MWAGSRDIGGDYLSGGVELNGWAEEVTVDWVIVGRIGGGGGGDGVMSRGIDVGEDGWHVRWWG